MTEPATNASKADYRDNSDSAAIQHSHRAAAVVCAVLLFALTITSLTVESPIGSDPHEPAIGDPDQSIAKVAAGIDPNTATWAELALLPGLGESVSKRIVKFREAQRRHSRQPAFKGPNDLLKVKGIGRKTLHRMRYLLRFDDPVPPD